MSIKDFTTIAHVDILAKGDDSKSYIRSIIDQEISDSELLENVNAAANNSALVINSDIANQDLPAIRKAFDVQLAKQKDADKYRLTVQYRGKGTVCEQFLTKKIVRDVSHRLSSTRTTSDIFARIRDQYEVIQGNIEQNSLDRHAELNIADRLVDDLNAGLSEIHKDINTLQPLAQINGSVANDTQSSFERLQGAQPEELLNELLTKLRKRELEQGNSDIAVFERSISELRERIQGRSESSELQTQPQNNGSSPMRVVNTSLVSRNSVVAGVLDSLNGLDIDSLQARIGQLQQNLRTDAIQMKDDVTNLKMLSGALADKRLIVDSVSEVKTLPFGAAPGLPHVLLFAFMATCIGGAIATFYRPELDGIGFESAESAGQTLGLPVIASFKADRTIGSQEIKRTGSIANVIVRYSEVGLFAFLLLVIVLCVGQVDIRAAFFENPFYGFAKMAGLFFGS